jgi:hypothetical protein
MRLGITPSELRSLVDVMQDELRASISRIISP